MVFFIIFSNCKFQAELRQKLRKFVELVKVMLKILVVRFFSGHGVFIV